MQQIISFLIRNKHALLFLALLTISLSLTIQSHAYHRSKFINAANSVSGGVYSTTSDIKSYFNLKNYNQQLLDENARLREQLANFEDSATGSLVTAELEGAQFEYITAKVIDNKYSSTNNYLTLKSQAVDEIQPEMGVITSKGILGITSNVNGRYCTVLSILSTNFRTNAKLRKSEHFGILSWNKKSPNEVVLSDIQRQAQVRVGDTIETSGKSFYFPKGIPIGIVQEAQLDDSENFYTLRVQLFNDMTNIGHAYIIKNRDKNKLDKLVEDAVDE